MALRAEHHPACTILEDGSHCCCAAIRTPEGAADHEEAIERRLMAAADEANARIASCHEEVACPKCLAPVGVKCTNLRGGSELKHPHRERWTQVVPAR